MKLHILFVLLILLFFSCSPSNKITTTWKKPSFTAAEPGKLIVYAKVNEVTFRNKIEDLVVENFKNAGYDAIAAYNNISEEDLKNVDSLRAKARSLNATSLITLRPLKKATEIKSTSQVSAGTGSGGSYGGFYNGFGGISLPISNGGKIEEHFILETNYYTQTSQGAEWLATMDVNMKEGLEETTTKITKMLIARMKKEGVL